MIGSNDQYVQFKFIHQLHYTPARLARMGLISSAFCPRCDSTEADYLHMFWSCPGVTAYWRELFSFFGDTLHFPVPLTPEAGLLGVLNDSVPTTHARTLLRIILFYARKLILLQWKSASAPDIQMLYRMVNKVLPIFKCIYKGRACPKKFGKIWQPWLDIADSFRRDTPLSQP